MADVNVTSLKEYDFFTYAKANGGKVEFNDPQAGYYLDYNTKESVLTLFFTLPLKAPVKAKDLSLEVYDREYFVDFSFAEKDPVKLVGAPAQCKLSVARPQEMSAALSQQLSQLGPNQRDPSLTVGAEFANKILGEMSVKPVVGGRPVVHFALVIAALAGLMLVAGALDAAFAQGGPFGAPRAQAPAPPMGGVLGWIFAKQAEFYRQFSSLIRAAKADGSAAWGLFGLSFLYGVFHAAGPGHGKAVISSYMVANEETWVRGVVLSFASALLQALVAVVLVGIAAALLNATAATMKRAVDLIEIVSYSLIILIGVRLLWVKGRVFLTTLRTLHRPAAVGAAVTPAHSLHGHGHHDHQHDHAHDHAHAHAHATTTVMLTPIMITIITSIAMATRTIMRTIIMITTTMPRPGGTRMRPSPRSSPAPADGSAGSPRSSPSACGRAPGPSWCWCLRWRRGCSGPAWFRPSSWGSAPPSPSPPSPPSPSSRNPGPSASPIPVPAMACWRCAASRPARRW